MITKTIHGQATLDEANNEVAQLRKANAQMEAALLWLIGKNASPTVSATVEPEGKPWRYRVTPIVEGCPLTPFVVCVENPRRESDQSIKIDALTLDDSMPADLPAARLHLCWYGGDLLAAVERDLREVQH